MISRTFNTPYNSIVLTGYVKIHGITGYVKIQGIKFQTMKTKLLTLFSKTSFEDNQMVKKSNHI